MKNLSTLVVVCLLVGCAAHPKRPDCEAHLKPINAPAPPASTGGHP